VPPLFTVETPALGLYYHQAATARVIGANLWVLGAAFSIPILFGGVNTREIVRSTWIFYGRLDDLVDVVERVSVDDVAFNPAPSRASGRGRVGAPHVVEVSPDL